MAEDRRDVPADVWRHLEQAYAQDAAGAFEQALLACEEAIELAPSLAEAHNLRGLVLEELGRSEEALEAYRRALQLDPEFVDARDNLSELQVDLSAPHRERAWDLLVSGEAEEALGASEAAVAIAPADAQAHNLRGLALEQLGRSAEAADAYRLAIQLDPDYEDAAANLAELEAEKLRENLGGQMVPGTAVSCEGREEPVVEQPRPRRRWRTVLYGLVLVAIIACLLASVLPSPRSYLNDPDTNRQAQTLFAWVLGLRPQNAVAYNRKGLDHHEQGELDRAIADYTRAIQLDPEFAVAYYNRALARHEQGELDKALSDYSRAIELDPESAPLYYNRGLVHAEMGAQEEAVSDFERFLALSDDPYWRERAEEHLDALGER